LEPSSIDADRDDSALTLRSRPTLTQNGSDDSSLRVNSRMRPTCSTRLAPFGMTPQHNQTPPVLLPSHGTPFALASRTWSTNGRWERCGYHARLSLWGRTPSTLERESLLRHGMCRCNFVINHY